MMSIALNDYRKTDEPVDSRQDIHLLHPALLHVKIKITRIECFRYDHELIEKRQLGNEEDDICGLIALSTDAGVVGFKEFAIPSGSLKCDLTTWVALFQRIKGLTLTETVNYAQRKQEAWGPVRFELFESSILDVISKIGLNSLNNKDQNDLLDRAYLFNHTQAYISF
jgi:hypothetical protein